MNVDASVADGTTFPVIASLEDIEIGKHYADIDEEVTDNSERTILWCIQSGTATVDIEGVPTEVPVPKLVDRDTGLEIDASAIERLFLMRAEDLSETYTPVFLLPG